MIRSSFMIYSYSEKHYLSKSNASNDSKTGDWNKPRSSVESRKRGVLCLCSLMTLIISGHPSREYHASSDEILGRFLPFSSNVTNPGTTL